ncbi:MAG: hypothetical protein ACRC20_10150 [Segniliparus sp.]|uniref:hypothetical protein n=1 Tax=Segniliparus sp. TaxID=2804064 RepID=UPI003F2C3F68
MTVKPRAPHGLKTEGQRLWRAVVAEFDLSFEPHKQRILFDACKTADLVQRLDEAAEDAPLTAKGSMGQEVISPLIAQSQSARSLLAQLLSRLDLPPTDEEQAERAEKLSQTRRKAAKTARFTVVGD